MDLLHERRNKRNERWRNETISEVTWRGSKSDGNSGVQYIILILLLSWLLMFS